MIDRYLLGDLPEQDLVAIEDAAFQDKQQQQLILEAESDLIDAYVRGDLTDRDRQLFEKRFLASAERRRKVAFARTFAVVAPEIAPATAVGGPVETVHDWRTSLRNFFSGLSPQIKLGFSVAAIVLLLSGAFVLFEFIRLRSQLNNTIANHNQQEQTLQQQVANERERNQKLQTTLEQEQQQREQVEQLLAKTEQTPNVRSESPPPVVTLALLAGIPRGESKKPKLKLQPATQWARLQIEIDPADDYKAFRAELHDRAGTLVWSRANLSARVHGAAKSVSMIVPANVLQPGQYELSLRGLASANKLEDVGFYYFDVVK